MVDAPTPTDPHRDTRDEPGASAQFVRFLAVGPVGVALGALQYELLWLVNPIDDHRAGVTWFFSSLIGIAWAHWLHCRFTFRGPRPPSWRRTIGRAYVLYVGSIALGTALMWLLADQIGMQRTAAWLVTTAATSLVNFVRLRRLLSPFPHRDAGTAVLDDGADAAADGAERDAGRGTTDDDDDPRGGIETDDVTVVVPTKNERDNIAPFLASLPAVVRLIVVDASSDDTAQRILALRPARTTVISHPGNISVARQCGAEAATTRWLLFTDCDVEFAPGYFAALRELRLDGAYGGIVGTKRTRDRFRSYYAIFRLGQRMIHFAGIPAASGSNMLMRRDALFHCGGFDPLLSVNEDSEVMWRCRRAGYDVAFADSLVVWARDHRRLERGVLRKFAHSTLRCVALYLNLLPERWKAADWGYWRRRSSPSRIR